MSKEPTKAEQMAKQRDMEWKARNRKARQDAAAFRAMERAKERSAKASEKAAEPNE